jgi:hypothetical protein
MSDTEQYMVHGDTRIPVHGVSKEMPVQHFDPDEKLEYDSLYQFATDSFRRAERAEAYIERLREENRSLVQTIRRVLRGTSVGSGE